MSGKANNAGIYNFDNLNAQTLYIKGKRFEDYITELVFEDQLEQDEINEIKLLLEYLDTTGLNSAWLVNNGNTNETLRASILALQTKLANIDTTTLTESSVLTNDNRNSVLKTRLDTAEGDIEGVETKTRFIVEASVTGTGDNTFSNYRTRVGPADGVEKGSALVELNMKNGPANELIGYTIKSNFNNDDYSDNESIYSHRDGRLTLLAETMRLQAADQIRIGNFAQYGDGGASTAINIGGRGQHVNIGCIDSLTATGTQSNIQIGQQSDTAQNTSTRISGNVYLSDARFEDLSKTERITVASLVSGWLTGYPGWILGFFSGAISLPYSDVWVMKDASIGASKKGDVATSNEIMLKELYVVNKDILSLTPKIGFYMAKADYSCTQLIGSHRTQVFEGEIVLRNNNTGVNVIDWAFTEANDKVNVVNVGGNDGILIHQGKSSTGATLRIINSCNGSIKLGLESSGTKGSAKPALEVMPYNNDGTFQTMTRIGFYPGLNQGTGKVGSYQLEVNQELDRDGIAVAQTNIITGVTVVNKINANSINTPGTITGIDVVGSTSISAPTATATSLVINGNYTGNTDARLYKNADNKLMWNGAEVGSGGVSSGGITYLINVASNISNPSPTPTETIMTAAYSGNPRRTITQAITSNSAFYIAKYTTEVFDEVTNPILTGLQQLNQYIAWNSQNQVGQLYGQLWFQATAVGSATLYQRTYASPITTTAAQLINGTPIPTPKGLYNIHFQRVLFPNINVVVSSGPVVLRYRVEGLVSGSWTNLYSMVGLAPPTVTGTANNLTITLDESVILSQTTPGATAVRLVLFIGSGTGTISQTSAGGVDLAAYSLIGLGANTPGLFRTMLYDGTNAKINIPYSTTPTLVEYDLPIDAPYNVSAFASPTLSTDLYFIQPTGGGHGTNAITLFFNEGTISHYHSTISPTQTTPTLAQVLNSGATASQPINMNTNKISGITALEGAANGNWNVKEITAGTGVSVTPTNGSYAIANTGILSVAAGSGTPGISVSTTSGAVTLQNSGIISITAGTGISVSTTSGVAVITNTATAAVGVAGTIRDEHQSLYEVGALPRKPDYWATNWSVADSTVRRHLDIYVSVDGRIIASATGDFTIRYSTDYGTTWNNATGLSIATTWTSICGTSNGSRLFAFGTFQAQNQVLSLVLYTSSNQGASWTQITSSAFTGLIKVNRVRCSGDGTYLLASDNTQIEDGRILYSTNGGTTWARQAPGDLPVGRTEGVAMSRSGAIQFLTWINNADNSSRILRSIDYGFTWSEVFGHITGGNWTRIECDATGRFVFATRYLNINTPQVETYRSDNYGVTWLNGGINGVEDIWVSATGQFVAGVSNPQGGGISYVVLSTDYGRFYTGVNMTAATGSSTTYRTINGSADGTILVLGSVNNTEGGFIGDGLLRIARQGRPSYSISGIQDVELVHTGTVNINSGTYNLGWTNKIDLTQFNIRYEISINYNYLVSQASYAFIGMGLNSVSSFTVQSNTAYQMPSVSNWTNAVNNGSFGAAEVYDQTYRFRFYCGYRPPSTWGPDYRNRQVLTGEISMNRRATADPGYSPDWSVNSFEILNKFTSDHHVMVKNPNNNTEHYIYSTNFQNTNEQHQRVNGTAIWNAAAGDKWTENQGSGNALSQGINNIALFFQDASFPGTTYPRAAEIQYRIYRVRK